MQSHWRRIRGEKVADRESSEDSGDYYDFQGCLVGCRLGSCVAIPAEFFATLRTHGYGYEEVGVEAEQNNITYLQHIAHDGVVPHCNNVALLTGTNKTLQAG